MGQLAQAACRVTRVIEMWSLAYSSLEDRELQQSGRLAADLAVWLDIWCKVGHAVPMNVDH